MRGDDGADLWPVEVAPSVGTIWIPSSLFLSKYSTGANLNDSVCFENRKKKRNIAIFRTRRLLLEFPPMTSSKEAHRFYVSIVLCDLPRLLE